MSSKLEYVTKDQVIEAIYKSDPFGVRECFGWRVKEIKEALRAIPAADVAPVRHGLWKYNTDFQVWNCSECGENPHKGTGVVAAAEKLPAYCPHCGARMDGVDICAECEIISEEEVEKNADD